MAVSLSAIDYNHIILCAQAVRLLHTVVFMPLRIGFLTVLVGTMLEGLLQAIAAGVEDPALEEQSAQLRHRYRLRYQG